MKLKTNQIILSLIFLSILSSSLSLYSFNQGLLAGKDNIYIHYHKNFSIGNKNPILSKLSKKIHIDNNWSVAKAVGICTGNGTYSEPYVIEDLVIFGKDSGNCILIENSKAYFIIDNCTLYNTEILGRQHFSYYSFYYTSGIKLINVSNSQVVNNNCSINHFGIFIENSENISISGNIVNCNDRDGIFLDGNCDDINITGNSLKYNSAGITIFQCNNILVSRNNLTNNWGSGIFIRDSFNIHIIENVLNNNRGSGIYLSWSHNNSILENTVNYSRMYGLLLWETHNNSVSGNKFNENGGAGIWIGNCYNNSITGNIMIHCGIKIDGNYEWLTSLNLDTSNLVNGKIFYFYANVVNLEPTNFTNAGQVILVNCTDSQISNLDTSDCSIGISLLYCNNNNLSRNIINNNFIGVYLYKSHYNNIEGNILNKNSEFGIRLDYSNFNTITANHINDISWFDVFSVYGGITLTFSNQNKIFENTIVNNQRGVYLECSDNNIISGNFFAGNDYGIYLIANNFPCGGSYSNKINDNIFIGNSRDIYIVYEDSSFHILQLIVIGIVIISVIMLLTKVYKKICKRKAKNHLPMLSIISLTLDLFGLVYLLTFFHSRQINFYTNFFTIPGIIYGLIGYRKDSDASLITTIIVTLLGITLSVITFLSFNSIIS